MSNFSLEMLVSHLWVKNYVQDRFVVEDVNFTLSEWDLIGELDTQLIKPVIIDILKNVEGTKVIEEHLEGETKKFLENIKNNIIEKTFRLVEAIRWVEDIPFLGEFESNRFGVKLNESDLKKIPAEFEEIHKIKLLVLPIHYVIEERTDLPEYDGTNSSDIQEVINTGDIPLAQRYLAMAYESRVRNHPDQAVVMLAAAAEIGIKEYFKMHSDIVGEILKDIPSPPIDKLVSVAEKKLSLKVDTEQQQTLKQISTKRNAIVHSTKDINLDEDKIKEWIKAVHIFLKTILPFPKINA